MKQHTHWIRIFQTMVSTLFLVAGCSAAPRPTSQLSATEHEQAAEQHTRTAEQHAAAYDPRARQVREDCVNHNIRNDIVSPCWTSVVNPTEASLRAAEQHHALAEAHRRAARTLIETEQRACQGISPDDLEQSPFEHVGDVVEVVPYTQGDARGARIRLAKVEGLSRDGLERLLACHLARNAAMGNEVPEMPLCPLVPRGVRAEVVGDGSSGWTVVVTSRDPAIASEVLRRAEGSRQLR